MTSLGTQSKLTYSYFCDISEASNHCLFYCSIVRGCVCSRAISVDNQYDPNYPKIVYSSSFNRTSLLNFTVTGFNDSDIIKFYRYVHFLLFFFLFFFLFICLFLCFCLFSEVHMLWQPQASKVMTAVKHCVPLETTLSLVEVISLLSYPSTSPY